MIYNITCIPKRDSMKGMLTLGMTMALLISFSSGAISEDWRTVHYNAENTGSTPFKSANNTFYPIRYWSAEIGNVESSPVTADLDDDGFQEIVIGTDNGIVAFDFSGEEIWRFNPSYPNPYSVDATSAIADLDGDGKLDVLLISQDNERNERLYCLDSDGRERWSIKTEHNADTHPSPKVADITDDDGLEVVLASTNVEGFGQIMDYNAFIRCISSDGEELWKLSRDGDEDISADTTPAVADLDNDGSKEVVVTLTPFTDFEIGGVTVLNSKEERARMALGEHYTPVSLADINNDGRKEIIVGVANISEGRHVNTIYALSFNANLEILWNFQITANYSITTTPAVKDLDGDGEKEIIIGGPGEKIYCLNSTGKELWNFSTYGAINSSPAIADVNGDGFSEIVIGSDDGGLRCLDYEGKELWNYTAGGKIGSPAIADIDNDEIPEILFSSGEGELHVLYLPINEEKQRPDLSISEDDIAVEDVVYEKENNLIKATIHNIGGKSAVCNVSFIIGSVNKSFERVQVPAGKSVELYMNWSSESTGKYLLSIQISEVFPDESDNSNNNASKEIEVKEKSILSMLSDFAFIILLIALIIIFTAIAYVLKSKRPKKVAEPEIMEKEKVACKHCNASIPIDAEKCPECGGLLIRELRCSKCGKDVEKDWRLCPRCGYSFEMLCKSCGKAIRRHWDVCPYCGEENH